MFRKIRHAARTVPLISVAAAVVGIAAGAPVGAQSVYVRVALQGMAQGKLSGASNGSGSDEIEAYTFSMSQPYGAAMPVAHLTTGAYAVPRLLQALATNEMLINPTITFLKPGQASGGNLVVYRIKAQHGNILHATVVLDTHHVPSIAFDVLLTDGVSYTTGGNAVPTGWSTGGTATNTANTTGSQAVTTTAPPPTISGNIPGATGAQQIIGT